MTENFKEKVDDYFGVCPICKSHDGYLNAGRGHFFICNEHRVVWYVGSNLFSDWRYETEEEQRLKWEPTEDYKMVEPTYYEETLRERALIKAELETEETAERGCPKVPGQSPGLPQVSLPEELGDEIPFP